MLKLHILILLLASSASIGCGNNGHIKSFNPIIIDTSITKAESHLLQAYPEFTKGVQLPSIENGVDSFEYRLWLHVSADIINLIRIRYDSSSWIISESIIWNHIPDYHFNRFDTINHLLETVVDSMTSRNIKPTIKISEFIDSLQYYNLEQAPSNIEIEGSHNIGTDAWGYTFELSNKHNYRIITYTCPGNIISLEDFHKSISNFLKFLHQTLNTNFTPC